MAIISCLYLYSIASEPFNSEKLFDLTKAILTDIKFDNELNIDRRGITKYNESSMLTSINLFMKYALDPIIIRDAFLSLFLR